MSFELILYSATATYEMIAALIYLGLIIRARMVKDLSYLNSIDRSCTCLFCVFRIAFTVALSIILIYQASINREHDYSQTYNPNGTKERKWTEI